LRILTVTHFFESHGGGIERVAGQLCRQFAGLGARPAWVASAGDPLPRRDIEAVPIRCVNPTEKLTGLPMPIPGIRGVRTLAREIQRSDAVVVHDALYLTSILALLIAKSKSKRVTLVQHIASIPFSSAVLRTLVRIANLLITRPMLWAADRRVFISEIVRRDLLGSRYQAGELLFNGVDEAIFHPGEARPAASGKRRREGSSRHLLFVGRYVEKKGLRVIRELAASRPDISFTLAGDGPIRPTEWGLANVRDLGAQDQEGLAELYRSADLLILPSVGEGFPLVIQEAMACGLPVICGAPAEQADPDAAQWLRGVDIDLSNVKLSARRCAEAIDGFALSPGERTKMSRYARRRYSWAAMAEKLMATVQ
jgi:glycosyltransferase involved in cell wall biosynthesis